MRHDAMKMTMANEGSGFRAHGARSCAVSPPEPRTLNPLAAAAPGHHMSRGWRRYVPLAATALLLFAALPALADEKITYNDHIRPILQNSCFSCHNRGG